MGENKLNVRELLILLQEELVLSEDILKITKNLDKEIQSENIDKIQDILKLREKRLEKLQNLEKQILQIVKKVDEDESSSLKMNENIQNLISSISNILSKISNLNQMFSKRMHIIEDDYSKNLKLMEIKKQKQSKS